MMLKVAIIGVGRMGSCHYDQYRKMTDVEIVALVDVEPEKITEKCKECGARPYDSADDMLANEAPDFVDIVTPSYLHAPLALKALSKGISVLCEKPAALAISDLKEVYACAKEHHAYFMAAHVLRFWPEYQWLQNAVKTQCHGALRTLKMVRRHGKPSSGSWQNWLADWDKSGCGTYDLHVHDLDIMVCMLGKPESSDTFHVFEKNKVCMAHSLYHYPNGVKVFVEGGWISNLSFEMSYEALFENGLAIFSNGKLTWYPADGEAAEVSPEECAAHQVPEMYTDSQGYYNEIRYFMHCLENHQQPTAVKEEELLTVLELIENTTGIHR